MHDLSQGKFRVVNCHGHRHSKVRLRFVKAMSGRTCHRATQMYFVLQIWKNIFARCTINKRECLMCLAVFSPPPPSSHLSKHPFTVTFKLSLTRQDKNVNSGRINTQIDDILPIISQKVGEMCFRNKSFTFSSSRLHLGLDRLEHHLLKM